MASGFVSSTELEEERKKRQEEWEQVRRPEDPAVAPEPEVCNKTLFEQLRDNKEAKDAELDEAKRFKNMIRGIDEDESDFLSRVDDMKNEALKNKKLEEQMLLRQVAEARAKLAEPAPLSIPKISPAISQPQKSKQASILSTAIKRKSTGERTAESKISRQDDGDAHPATSAMKVIGVIPGIGNYDASSDSASSSDEDCPILPILEVAQPEKKSEHNH